MDSTAAKIDALLRPPVSGHDIIYCLTVKGVSQREIAAETGVTPALVSYVIWGHRRNLNVATLIAAKLDTTLQKLWGDAYRDLVPGKRPASALAA